MNDDPKMKMAFVPVAQMRDHLPGPICAAIRNLDMRAAESNTMVAVIMVISANDDGTTTAGILSPGLAENPAIALLVRNTMLKWLAHQDKQQKETKQ